MSLVLVTVCGWKIIQPEQWRLEPNRTKQGEA